jgi:hypothetical protein
MGRANTGTDAPNPDPFGHNGRSVYPPPQDQINNRLKTMGYWDPAQMGKIMADAVAAGIIQAQKMLAEQPGATHTQRWEGVREYGFHRYPTMGMRGLIGTAGAITAGRFVWNRKPGQPGAPTAPGVAGAPGAEAPLSDAQQAAASVAQASQAAQDAAAQTGAPPPPSPQAPSEVAPEGWGPAPSTGIGAGFRIGNRYWGARAWSGYTNAPQAPQAPPEAPQVPPEAAEAAGATAVSPDVAAAQTATTATSQATTATATTGTGIRNAIGQALMGMGARGLPGAWEGLAGALPEAAGVLGPLGIGMTAVTGAYEGINQLGNFIASQRQQGAYYQGILGGTNLGGQWQRLQQIGFRFSTLGNLSGAQANALFQGVTGLDMTGAQRQNAMQQAIQMYDDLGVSIQSSIQNITIAAQNGNKELAGLADAINNVTQAAVGAGVNANVARQNFTQLYGAASQAGITGPAGANVAGGISAAQAGLGPMFQNQNFSGLFGTQAMLMQASALNMAPDAYLGGLLTGNTALAGRGIQATAREIIPANQIMPYLNQAAQNLGLTQAMARHQLTPQNLQSLGAEMIKLAPGATAYGWQAAWNAQGYNLANPDLAAILSAAAYTGNWDVNTAGKNWAAQTVELAPFRPLTARQRGELTPAQLRAYNTEVSTLQGRRALAGVLQGYGQNTQYQAQLRHYNNIQDTIQQVLLRGTGSYQNQTYTRANLSELYTKENAAIKSLQSMGAQALPGGGYGLDPNREMTLLNANPLVRKEMGDIGLSGDMPLGRVAANVNANANQAREWYMQNIFAKGHIDPVMEAILKNPSLSAPGTLFQVMTKQGQTLATLQDLQQHYMANVQAGQVQVMTGQYANQQLSNVLGVPQASRQVVANIGDTQGTERRLRAELANQQQQNRVIGKVVISASSNLQSMFNFQTSGNVSMDNTAAVGGNYSSYPTTPTAALPSFSNMQG